MRAAERGERDLVRALTQGFRARRNALAFTDDCAAIPWGDDFLLLSTDVAQRETHFPPAMRAEDVGAYVVNANLSDLAAMGAEALGILLAVGLPPETDDAFLRGLREGVRGALDAADAELLGGDTKPNPTLTIAGTGVGRVPRAEILTRSGARPGDVLAVTGEVGGAGAGLAALAEGRSPEYAERLLRPRARLAEGRALARNRAATAALDLSDGLALGAHDLARASGTGARVDATKLPLHGSAVALDRGRARDWALYSGGDFELLVAVPPERWEAARRAVELEGGTLTAIGEFTDGRRGVELRDESGERDLPPRGSQHFGRA